MVSVFFHRPWGYKPHAGIRVQVIGKQRGFLGLSSVEQIAVPVGRADSGHRNLYGHSQVSVIFAVIFNGRVFGNLFSGVHIFRLLDTQGVGCGSVGGSGISTVRAFPVPVPLIQVKIHLTYGKFVFCRLMVSHVGHGSAQAQKGQDTYCSQYFCPIFKR